MSEVLDYSWGRPDLAEVKVAGFIGVMRYLSNDTTGKNISAEEATEIRSAGLELGLVWEDTSNAVLGGAARGTADAKTALAQAQAVDYTGPLYFAIDYDAPESDQAAIAAYFTAVAQVIGLGRTRAYGGYGPLSRLYAAGLITGDWQTTAWSGVNRNSEASLFQTGAQYLGCDINTVLKDDWNQISEGGNVPTIVDQTLAAELANLAWLAEGPDQTNATYLASVEGQPVETVIPALINSQQHKDFVTKFLSGAAALDQVPVLQAQIDTLTKQVAVGADTVADTTQLPESSNEPTGEENPMPVVALETVPEEPSTAATEPILPEAQSQEGSTDAGKSSQPVQVEVSSVVPSKPLVTEQDNNSDDTLTLSQLDARIEAAVEQEVAKYTSPAEQTAIKTFLEGKPGQVVVGMIGSTLLTIISAASGGPTGKIALVAYGVNLLHAVGNFVLHLSE
jgi:hypothetical protein